MWCATGSEEVLRQLEVGREAGLSTSDVERRLDRHGPNRLASPKRKPLILLFFEQLNSVLIYILAAAALLSFFLGEISDGIIILVVVLINGVVGVVQEAKAERALEALKRLTSPHALVRRNGRPVEIDADQIVPGDIVLLDAGRIVPCDLRLLQSASLRIEESALTGESVPVEKNASADLDAKTTALGDQITMAFMSTVVTFGRGEGVAVATGMETEIGRIARLIEQESEEQTPLQRKLDRFGRVVGFAILGLCAVMFGISMVEQFLRYHTIPQEVLFEMFLTAVSLAVAAIPEGLAAIVAIVLALGVERMSRQNAIVRRLPAVETLGSVTVICSDKTGTLTQNRMTVQKVFVGGRVLDVEDMDPGNDAHLLLARAMALCNDATYSPDGSTGDPTEIALLEAASRIGQDKATLDDAHPRIAEQPFDSVRKMMTTVHDIDGQSVGFTKGALDGLLTICTSARIDGEVVPLTPQVRSGIMKEAERLSLDALRVLGAANGVMNGGELEKDLVFLGFMGMMDPPRLEVRKSIEMCKRAGITPVMITGDHRNTALAIARQLDIAREESQTLSGSDVEGLTDQELNERARTVRVFARVSPEHKVRIVKAFQSIGHLVSMTGDGVNDAPSLKAADIGVAMGVTGTDVAKGASDMVLTDDNFATIVSAVGEGRHIYDNIKKSISFLLSCNTGEIIAIFTAIVVGMVPPLRPIHILWVNLITDTLPALSLGVDSGDPRVLNRPPRQARESLFAGATGPSIVAWGLFIGIITLGVYILALRRSPDSVIHAQTMAFAVLSLSQLFHAFNLRHPSRSIFSLGLLTNKYLLGSLLIGGLLQVAVITLPAAAEVFKVTPLGLEDWLIVLAFAVSPLVVGEAVKLVRAVVRRFG